LLLCEDEFVELDELDDFDEFDEEDPDEVWVAVELTWCNATSPLNVPKPISEAMAKALLNLFARAIACALGIFCGALGFWPVGRCVCARFCGIANCGLPSCDVTNLLVYGWFCGGIHEARVS
jgi:hypothetical protein